MMRSLPLGGVLLLFLFSTSLAGEPSCAEVGDNIIPCGCAYCQVCVVAGDTGSVLQIYAEDDHCGGSFQVRYKASNVNVIRSNISPYPCLQLPNEGSGNFTVSQNGSKQVQSMHYYNFPWIGNHPGVTCTPGSYGGPNRGYLGEYEADVEIRVTSGPNAGSVRECWRR